MRPLKRASGSFYNIYIYTTSLLLFDINPLYIFSGVQGCYSNFASLFSKVYRPDRLRLLLLTPELLPIGKRTFLKTGRRYQRVTACPLRCIGEKFVHYDRPDPVSTPR